MTALEAKLIERLKRLPPNRVAEVVDFVDFLASREERAAASQRLGDGLARLDALRLPALSEAEVEAEIQAARADSAALEPLRFVVDTNLLVSGVIATGAPRRLLDAARAGHFELCSSEILLAELVEVLSRAKFLTRLAHAGLTPEGLVDDLRRLAFVVAPTQVPRVVPTDPDDDHVIAAAIAGQADLIVSGDQRDLLPLGSYAGIPIVNAQQALQRLQAPP